MYILQYNMQYTLQELSRGKEAALEQERNRLHLLHKKVRGGHHNASQVGIGGYPVIMGLPDIRFSHVPVYCAGG